MEPKSRSTIVVTSNQCALKAGHWPQMHFYMYIQYSLISVSCGGWGLLTETDGGVVGGGETVLFMTVVWWDLKGACICSKQPYTITTIRCTIQLCTFQKVPEDLLMMYMYMSFN